MNRKAIFFLFFLFLTAPAVFSQTLYPAISGRSVFKSVEKISNKGNHSVSRSMLVSPAFYVCNLAFFCRQEIKFEKTTGIPFKFRLGSVDQVDHLEGKRVR